MGRVPEPLALSEGELVHGREFDVVGLIVLVDAALRHKLLNVVVAVLIDLFGKRPVGHQSQSIFRPDLIANLEGVVPGGGGVRVIHGDAAELRIGGGQRGARQCRTAEVRGPAEGRQLVVRVGNQGLAKGRGTAFPSVALLAKAQRNEVDRLRRTPGSCRGSRHSWHRFWSAWAERIGNRTRTGPCAAG